MVNRTKKSKLQAASAKLAELLKGIDNYAAKANFKIPKKNQTNLFETKNENKSKYKTSVGSVWGGLLTIAMEAFFGYMLINGVIKMVSGKNDFINSKIV